MRRRIENPTGRKLNVRWSTERWVPRIDFVWPNGGSVLAQSEVCAAWEPPFVEKRGKRKHIPVLWVRSHTRSGSRTTWR